MKIKVAACQMLANPSQPAKQNADKIIMWIERAAAEGVDVVSFPEACLSGYTYDAEYWKTADSEDFKREGERIIEASRRFNIAVVIGTPRWEKGRLLNSLLVVDKGGVVRGYYDKTHLAEEWPEPGRSFPVYEVAGVKSCFIICHDVRYPELVGLPVIAGAQVCYFCSNEAGMAKEYKFSAYRAMPISRAAENSVYLVMANAPGDLDNVRLAAQSHGNSKVVDPDGNVMCEAGFFEERLVTAVLDIDKANREMALRAVNDDSKLRDWMKTGVEFVDMPRNKSGQGIV